MVSKAKKLARCNEEFLRELAKGISLSYRSYVGKSKQDLIRLLCKKLKAEDVDKILKLYMLCLKPKEVADTVRPNDVGKITRMIRKYFSHEKALQEVKIGLIRCDLVTLDDGNVRAFEIKTARDKIMRAIEQTNYYSLWANEVYLVYDKKHKSMVKKFRLDGIGLLETSKESITLACPPVENQINPLNLLSLLPYAYLKRVASKYGVKAFGRKTKFARRLNETMSQEDVHRAFLDYLTSKVIAN